MFSKIEKFFSKQLKIHSYIFFADTSDETHNVYLGRLPSLLFGFSFGILLTIFMVLLITSIGFFLNIQISKLHLLFSAMVALPIFYIFLRRFLKLKGLEIMLIVVSIFLAFVISTKIAGNFFDLSYDGQWYHMETVIALNEGWVPFRHELSLKQDSGISSQDILNSYPKASEILEAVIYKFFGTIEIAKGINFLILFMTFGFVLSSLLRLKNFSPLLSLISTLLLLINPVVLSQYLSFYLDASMYSLILVLISLLLTFYLTNKKYILLAIFFCVCILWNIKVTAIAYSTIISIAFLVYIWYKEKVLLFFKLAQIYAMAVLVSIIVIGFNPYFTNILQFRNPFYSGSDSRNYIFINMPPTLYHMSSVQRFFYSLFSQTASIRGNGKTYRLKMPFTFSTKELKSLTNDNTIGGFGPLFSGVFIISIVGIILIIFSKRCKSSKRDFLFLSLVVVTSSILFPVSSYARFIPQFWLLPCFVSIYLLYEKGIVNYLIGVALIIVIFGNNYLISKAYIMFNLNNSQGLRQELKKISEQSKNKPLIVDFGVLRSNRIRFKEANIAFYEKPITECRSFKRSVLYDYDPASEIKICYMK